MKIAIVKKVWWPLPTSTQHTWAPGIVAAMEAESLVTAGESVRVYCAKGSKVAGEVVDFGMMPVKENPPSVVPIQQSIRELYAVNTFIGMVIEHLRANPVDIIHIHDYRDYPIFEAANLGIPIVATIHGDYAHNFDGNSDYIAKTFAHKNLIALMKPTHVPEGMVKPVGIVPNSFDAARFELIEEPADRLVFVSRITAGKGADMAIEIAELAKTPLSIYGGQFENKEFEELFQDKVTKSKYATYEGYLPQKNVEQALNGRALLFPIREPEGFPLVVLEALSSGTPVVAFRQGGVQDLVIDGVTGFLVEPGDLQGFVDALARIDEIDRSACRQYVIDNFSPAVVAQKHIEVFQKVIKKYEQKAI